MTTAVQHVTCEADIFPVHPTHEAIVAVDKIVQIAASMNPLLPDAERYARLEDAARKVKQFSIMTHFGRCGFEGEVDVDLCPVSIGKWECPSCGSENIAAPYDDPDYYPDPD